jgi:hypothetical protein
MSNLAKYNGNFIEFIDTETKNFNGSHSSSFDTVVSELDIDAFCKIAVLPCDSGASVSIDTERIEDFNVYMEGTRLVLKQKPQTSFSINSVNGSTVIDNISGNMSIINGEIFVNGQRINQAEQKQVTPSSVIIRCPQRVKLDANLAGESMLASKVVFTRAKVNLSGSGTLGIAAESLKIKISGGGNSYIVMRGGDLDVSVSGQGDLRIKGEWNDAEICLLGMGRVETSGDCLGDYSAKVSGMGKIKHSGTVSGKIRKKVSGMGSCQIQGE